MVCPLCGAPNFSDSVYEFCPGCDHAEHTWLYAEWGDGNHGHKKYEKFKLPPQGAEPPLFEGSDDADEEQ